MLIWTPCVLNELIGEPLSTTEYSSTDIFDIYRILLLNSKNALQWQFLTTAIISVFSQRLKVKCSKCRRQKKTELTRMRKVDATSPFRVTWLSQLHVLHAYVSPLNKKRLVLKFVISVLKLEEVTENLLLNLLPLDHIFLDHSFVFASQRLQPQKTRQIYLKQVSQAPLKVTIDETKLMKNYTNKNNTFILKLS